MTNKLVKKIVCFAVMAVLTIVLIVVNVLAFAVFPRTITGFLSGNGDFGGEGVEEALKGGDELCTQIEEDSIVLLKNKDNALPLKSNVTKINLFGYGAYEGFLLKGIGSGSSTIVASKQLTLLDAFAGKHRVGDDGTNWDDPSEVFTTYEINPDIKAIYDNSANYSGTVRGANPAQGAAGFNLAEPRTALFDDLWSSAKSYSDVAVFVISRVAGENMGSECPDDYLDVTAAEKEMLNKLHENFGTVVVILNTSNTMHLGFLDECNVDACLYVGLTGQSGARAIPEVLSGKVNPSGKTTDIITKSKEIARTYDPTWVNHNVSGGSIQYLEDIYYGYKWFETADKVGFFTAKGTSYDQVVQYPFGHGESYTTFDWSLKSVSYVNGEGAHVEVNGKELNLSTLKSDTEISVIVNVKNNGGVAGKDIVELYYTPPYNATSNLEKAEINLLDFQKTISLEANDEAGQDVELTFTPYDLASYDINANSGDGAYVLEAGDFEIKLMKDSHHAVETVLTLKASNDIVIDTDPVTGEDVRNRFTGDTAYTGVPTDGSKSGLDTQYLSRADFAGTFPKAAKSPSNVNTAANYMNTAYDSAANSTTVSWNQSNGYEFVKRSDGQPVTYDNLYNNGLPDGVTLDYNYDLIAELAANYDSETWDKVLDQLDRDEVFKLIQAGGFRRESLASVAMPALFDYDGPAGFNRGTITGDFNGSNNRDANGWTAFTSEAIMACSWNETLLFSLGRSMGNEANVTACDGWYAPGVNLHRSNYTARNFEYYSEDGVLSGKLAVQVIAGAKTNGLTCYLKHFTASEAGPNPKAVNTWLTEQNLRENYLRPFEIATKGIDVELVTRDDAGNVTKTQTIHVGANAIMTAFNRVGASWAGANYAMNVEILRGEWGFNGGLITDWTTGGDGTGEMNVNQGVRGGNDLWLNPDNSKNKLSGSDKTEVYCARIAAHNLLYMFADTINTNQVVLNSGANLDSFQVNKSLSFNDSSSWWQAVLITLDVLVVLGFVVWALFLTGVAQNLIAKIKKTPVAQAASAEGGSSETQSPAEETPAEVPANEPETTEDNTEE